ncbi:MAG TPA: hypothetical protein G4O01_02250 [Dehalococcoidia bacterium]|nr:hypothetical protein [Dehalococcoidia bacterium]
MKLEPEAEPEIQAEPETAPEPEPVPEAVPAIPPDSEPEPEPAPAPEPAPESEAAPELPPEPSPAPVAEAPPEPTAVSTTEPKLEPDPETGAIAVTVEELNLAFGADKAATNAKLADKTLRVSGRVDKIIVKDYLDIQYILLTSREGTGRWNVRCTFDREHGAKLLRLKAGETVTVQGSYDSCERNIILRDCLLIG